ncbi:hypothetical protein SAMN04487995_5346 [Dyadobacter koreensis]|uniref:Outer membrane protein beta-barrel domain-containing protein n=1 Tax=Dyadobacter koreensis TaxID=408657 RepID=A0A1H6ZU71_9BACT|nr:hypothetical protein [Dyadobacter koreensis]SEJ56768.1 hypothetical protein SAMN04487995_5346 [Dyadobacter koreensis]
MKILFSLFISILILSSVNAQDVEVKNKFINHTEFGGLFGRVKYSNGSQQNTVDSRTSLTLQTFNGIQVSRKLGAGIILGADWYKSALINPVAAGIRYDLSGRSNARFFVIADAGYGFTWLHQDSDGYKTKGGWMINPGIGLRIGNVNTSSFTLSLTYKRQEVFAEKPLLWNQTERREERVYNRIAARIGISF